jgi:hypothetical protein
LRNFKNFHSNSNILFASIQTNHQKFPNSFPIPSFISAYKAQQPFVFSLVFTAKFPAQPAQPRPMEPSPTSGRLTEQDRRHRRLMSAPPALGASSHLVHTEMEAAPCPPPFPSINWCRPLFIFLVTKGLKAPLIADY